MCRFTNTYYGASQPKRLSKISIVGHSGHGIYKMCVWSGIGLMAEEFGLYSQDCGSSPKLALDRVFLPCQEKEHWQAIVTAVRMVVLRSTLRKRAAPLAVLCLRMHIWEAWKHCACYRPVCSTEIALSLDLKFEMNISCQHMHMSNALESSVRKLLVCSTKLAEFRPPLPYATHLTTFGSVWSQTLITFIIDGYAIISGHPLPTKCMSVRDCTPRQVWSIDLLVPTRVALAHIFVLVRAQDLVRGHWLSYAE